MIQASQSQAAFFVLQKNFLTAVNAGSVGRLVEALVGLPATTPAAPVLAVRSRLAGFQPDHLLAGLSRRGELIEAVLMQSSPYIVPTAAYPAWHAATVRQRNQAANSQLRLWGLDNRAVEALGAAILAAAGDQPITAETMWAELPGHLLTSLNRTSRGGRVETTTSLNLALQWLLARGELVILRPDLDWRNLGPASYAPLREAYPQVELAAGPGEAEAQAALTRAYLAAFGPATEADISAWTGFSKSETARAVGALAAETTLVMVEGIPGMMLLLKEQAGALAGTRPVAAPLVNLLPAGDCFVTAHRASRARLLADRRQQRQVFDSVGASQPVILVNGRVAGLWEWSQERLTWRLLVEVNPAVPPLIEAEMARLAAFLGLESQLPTP